jgi:hypothetical protein
MRHFSIAWILVVITLAASSIWVYRLHAANEAAQFSPAIERHVWVPSGTMIVAAMRNRILASSKSGDPVTAFVSTPVIFQEQLVIPVGAALNGTIERVRIEHGTGSARIKFDMLVINGHKFSIQTQGVFVHTATENDLRTISKALQLLMGTTLGVAVGAATGDPRMIDDGLIEGAINTTDPQTSIPIRVTLADRLAL